MTQATATSEISFPCDLAEAKKFLEAVRPNETIHVFSAIIEKTEDGKKKKGRIDIEGTLTERWEELQRLNQAGNGIFVAVNTGTPKGKYLTDADITKVNAAYLDFDRSDLPEPNYKLEPSLIVDTSHGKHHAYFLTDDVSLDEFGGIQKHLISQYNGDKAIKNLSRIMRLPGFYHMKGEPIMVRVRKITRNRYKASDFPIKKIAAKPPSDLAEFTQKIISAKDGEVDQTIHQVSFDIGSFRIDRDQFESAVSFALQMRNEAISGDLRIENEAKDKQRTTSANRAYNIGFEQGLKKAKASPNQFHVDVVREVCNGRLVRHTHGLNAFFDGKLTNNISTMYVDFRERTGVQSLPKDLTSDVLSIHLDNPENQVNVLKDQFLGWAKEHNDASYLDQAADHLGVTEAIQRVLIKKFFMRLAARTLYPGCKADDVLVMYGKQGISKTDFFVNLLGTRYYDTVNPDDSDKDGLLKLNRIAIADMDEIGYTFSRKGNNQLKSFLSRNIDSLRVPYGKQIDSFPRHCVFVGTSNDREMLRDHTGHRRFHIIEPGYIDKAWFEENISKVIGYCVNQLKEQIENKNLDPLNLPKNACIWWLDESEEKVFVEYIKSFEQHDWLEEPVLEAVKHLPPKFTLTSLLRLCTVNDAPIKITDRLVVERVTKILEKQGLIVKRVDNIRMWVKPEGMVTIEAPIEPLYDWETDKPLKTDSEPSVPTIVKALVEPLNTDEKNAQRQLTSFYQHSNVKGLQEHYPTFKSVVPSRERRVEIIQEIESKDERDWIHSTLTSDVIFSEEAPSDVVNRLLNGCY
jgi:predicted P-loop ATPase